MAQGKQKLKSKASSVSRNKNKQHGYKNQVAKSKRGTSQIITSKNPNVQKQQNVMKTLTKAINKKAEDDLKARSFQTDGKTFKIIGKVDESKEKTKGSSSNKKSKPQISGKKKRKK